MDDDIADGVSNDRSLPKTRTSEYQQLATEPVERAHAGQHRADRPGWAADRADGRNGRAPGGGTRTKTVMDGAVWQRRLARSTRTRRRGTLPGMPRYVALLRGVNVGGHGRLAMADLRRIAASLGYSDAATYVQSGNLAFTSDEACVDDLADALETAMARTLRARPATVVLRQAAFEIVRVNNPFPQETDPRRLHVVFSRAPLTETEAANVAAAQDRARAKGSRDQAETVDGVLYLHTPDGLGRSILAVELTKGAGDAGQSSTMRNWATVTRLSALLRSTGA